MARLYANENFPLPVVEGLRQFGHDVITIQETGKAEQRTSDDDVLQFAMADDRAVLTPTRGQPYGSETWMRNTPGRLGLESTMRRRARARQDGCSGPPAACRIALRP